MDSPIAIALDLGIFVSESYFIERMVRSDFNINNEPNSRSLYLKQRVKTEEEKKKNCLHKSLLPNASSNFACNKYPKIMIS
jgi:hypothetical protein